MKCEDCFFFYRTTITEDKLTYHGLADNFVPMKVERRVRACGYQPGGIVLDDAQKFCANFSIEEPDTEEKIKNEGEEE